MPYDTNKGIKKQHPFRVFPPAKKVVDVSKCYNIDRLPPIYDFDGAPLFIMTSD